MGEKSGSVVSHSLIFDSQVAAESGGLGVGELGGRCVVFFCDECGEVRRLSYQTKKKVHISNPWSILHFFLWWGSGFGTKIQGFLFEGHFRQVPVALGELSRRIACKQMSPLKSSFSSRKIHDTSKGWYDTSKDWWVSQAAMLPPREREREATCAGVQTPIVSV